MPRFTLEVRVRIADASQLSDRAWRRHLEAANVTEAWYMAKTSVCLEKLGRYRAVILNKNGNPTGPWQNCSRPKS